MREKGAAALLALLLLMGLSATLSSQEEDVVEYAPWCEDGIDNDGDGLTDAEDEHCGPDWGYGNGAPYEEPPLVAGGD
jgi:hypothetical protein